MHVKRNQVKPEIEGMRGSQRKIKLFQRYSISAASWEAAKKQCVRCVDTAVVFSYNCKGIVLDYEKYLCTDKGNQCVFQK